jgi:hypothetical protein
MFNTNTYRAGDVTNTLKINACSGGIYKTYKESWFKRFHLKSELANELFTNYAYQNVETGEYYSDRWGDNDYNRPQKNREQIIILQMIICGDMEVIAELIKKADFDRYFDIPELEKGND